MGHRQNTYCNGDCDSFQIEQNRNRHFWLTPVVDHSDHLLPTEAATERQIPPLQLNNLLANLQQEHRRYQISICLSVPHACTDNSELNLNITLHVVTELLASAPCYLEKKTLPPSRAEQPRWGVRERPSNPTACWWERGKPAPRYLASMSQGTAIPSQCRRWTFSELVWLASPPRTACFFFWICESNQLRRYLVSDKKWQGWWQGRGGLLSRCRGLQWRWDWSCFRVDQKWQIFLGSSRSAASASPLQEAAFIAPMHGEGEKFSRWFFSLIAEYSHCVLGNDCG